MDDERLGTVKYMTMKSEESGMIKKSDTWTMIYTICHLVVIIMTFTNIIMMYNSQTCPCDKCIPARELNRLQWEIRWLKAKNKRIENNQHNIYIARHLINGLYTGKVLVLLISVNVVVFLFLWLKFKDDSSKRTSNTSNETSSASQRTSHAIQRLSRKPRGKYVIVQFTSTWSSVDENLAKSFLTDHQIPFMFIREEKEIYDIDAKLVFLFVKCNERHIILEDADDTSQLKRKTVEIIEHAGGKAVVIYMLHCESGYLKDGCLYSKKLTSINLHPILKKLSKEDCVISTDKELSKFQIHHLQKLYKKYSSVEV